EVAAIVGAQDSPRKDDLQFFSQAFYHDLLDHGVIDAACAKARDAIGRQNNNDGWQRRDWGLPVLSVAVSPNHLGLCPDQPKGSSDAAQIVDRCVVLRQFALSADRHTAPFVGLGWAKERWECLSSLRSRSCMVIKGTSNVGKSWLVKRTLRDAVYL